MSDKHEKLGEWAERAEENVDKWGVQPPAHVVLAMLEELAEIAEELIEASEVSSERPSAGERDLMYYLVELTVFGNEVRNELEDRMEDDDGSPLPPDERPRVLGDIDDGKQIQREIDDLGPLVIQLAESVDEYSKW